MAEVPQNFHDIKTSLKKADEDFRVYSEDNSLSRVVEHYRDMRKFQTVDFYKKMEHKYSFENGAYRRIMTIEEAFDELERSGAPRARGLDDSPALFAPTDLLEELSIADVEHAQLRQCGAIRLRKVEADREGVDDLQLRSGFEVEVLAWHVRLFRAGIVFPVEPHRLGIE